MALYKEKRSSYPFTQKESNRPKAPLYLLFKPQTLVMAFQWEPMEALQKPTRSTCWKENSCQWIHQAFFIVSKINRIQLSSCLKAWRNIWERDGPAHRIEGKANTPDSWEQLQAWWFSARLQISLLQKPSSEWKNCNYLRSFSFLLRFKIQGQNIWSSQLSFLIYTLANGRQGTKTITMREE